MLAAAPVWVGLPENPPASLAAIPCMLPSFPVRRAVLGLE